MLFQQEIQMLEKQKGIILLEKDLSSWTVAGQILDSWTANGQALPSLEKFGQAWTCLDSDLLSNLALCGSIPLHFAERQPTSASFCLESQDGTQQLLKNKKLKLS